MTGPRPAGRRWTLTDDDMLRKRITSGMKTRLIAQKLKRSIGAIRTRIYLFKKPRSGQHLRPDLPSPHGRLSRSADQQMVGFKSNFERLRCKSLGFGAGPGNL